MIGNTVKIQVANFRMVEALIESSLLIQRQKNNIKESRNLFKICCLYVWNTGQMEEKLKSNSISKFLLFSKDILDCSKLEQHSSGTVMHAACLNPRRSAGQKLVLTILPISIAMGRFHAKLYTKLPISMAMECCLHSRTPKVG